MKVREKNRDGAHVIPCLHSKTSAPPEANMRAIPGHVLAIQGKERLVDEMRQQMMDVSPIWEDMAARRSCSLAVENGNITPGIRRSLPIQEVYDKMRGARAHQKCLHASATISTRAQSSSVSPRRLRECDQLG